MLSCSRIVYMHNYNSTMVLFVIPFEHNYGTSLACCDHCNCMTVILQVCTIIQSGAYVFTIIVFLFIGPLRNQEVSR